MNDFDDAHVDVGFEQREADLARDLVDVAFGQPPAVAELGEDAFETVAQRVEHRRSGYSSCVVGRRRAPPRTPAGRTRRGRRRPRRRRRPSPAMPSSDWIASTMPPLAVPSSLVSTMPVTSTASANCLACTRPFWPGRRVDHEQHFLARALGAIDDAAQLLQLLHEVRLRVQAAGGVDEHEVGAAARRRRHRVEHDRAGIGAFLAAHELAAGALGPEPELIGGRGAERVGRREHDPAARRRPAAPRACRSSSSSRRR